MSRGILNSLTVLLSLLNVASKSASVLIASPYSFPRTSLSSTPIIKTETLFVIGFTALSRKSDLSPRAKSCAAFRTAEDALFTKNQV
ncbi:Uncharacterised protein [Streptococcus pneumoniae]|nr:Uncharacterised protein [Streptococcus pneumoniae]